MRDELEKYLKENFIGTIRQWGGFSISHFEALGYDIKLFPRTKKLFDHLLLLPMNHLISEEQAYFICEVINKFYEKN